MFVAYMHNNPFTYVYKSKLDACQIRWFSELALLDFAIKYRMGRYKKATDTLSHHPLNPDSPPAINNNIDKVNVISYPLVCDDTNENYIKTAPDLMVFEVVNWHLGTTKIMNDLKWRHKPSVVW